MITYPYLWPLYKFLKAVHIVNERGVQQVFSNFCFLVTKTLNPNFDGGGGAGFPTFVPESKQECLPALCPAL